MMNDSNPTISTFDSQQMFSAMQQQQSLQPHLPQTVAASAIDFIETEPVSLKKYPYQQHYRAASMYDFDRTNNHSYLSHSYAAVQMKRASTNPAETETETASKTIAGGMVRAINTQASTPITSEYYHPFVVGSAPTASAQMHHSLSHNSCYVTSTAPAASADHYGSADDNISIGTSSTAKSPISTYLPHRTITNGPADIAVDRSIAEIQHQQLAEYAESENTNESGVLMEDYSTQANLQAIMEKRRRRRESHNAVERRRRDNINERIQELGTLLPDYSSSVIAVGVIEGGDNESTSTSTNSSAAIQKMNKGTILRKSVEQIKKLQNDILYYQHRIRELEIVLQQQQQQRHHPYAALQ